MNPNRLCIISTVIAATLTIAYGENDKSTTIARMEAMGTPTTVSAMVHKITGVDPSRLSLGTLDKPGMGKQMATLTNPNFRIVKDSLRIWSSGSSWLDSIMCTYTYDAKGQLAGRQIKRWSPIFGAWGNDRTVVFTFDERGREVAWESQEWVGSWRNQTKERLNYNSASFPDSQTSSKGYEWNSTRESWVQSDSMIYTRNTSGQTTELRLLFYNDTTGIWSSDIKFTITYNGNLPSMERMSFWSSSSYSWLDITRHTYSYDANGRMVQDYAELYITPPWTPLSRTTYTYDGTGNCTSEITASYDYGTWVNYSKTVREFDVNGNETHNAFTKWSTFSGTWNNRTQLFSFYNAASAVNPVAHGKNVIQNGTRLTSRTLASIGTGRIAGLQASNLRGQFILPTESGFSSGAYIISATGDAQSALRGKAVHTR